MIHPLFQAGAHLFIDQYGDAVAAGSLTELRTAARDKLGATGAPEAMYIDKKDGSTVQIGFVIGRHWFTAFQRVEVPA